MPSPVCVMSRCEFDALGACFARRLGVELRPGLLEVVSARLWPRVDALGLSGFTSYVKYLENATRGGDELDAAAALVFGERHELLAAPGELDEFAGGVVRELIEARRYARRLRVWVPSCGGGAEAYSVALAVLGTLGADAASWFIEVVGTDVSDGAIAAARRSEFDADATRRLSPAVRSAWFGAENGMLRPRAWLRERVKFEVLDARDACAAMRLGTFDCVVMRDRMRLMDRGSRELVVGVIGRHLAADGVLVVGRGDGATAARGGMNVNDGVLLSVARVAGSALVAA